MRDIPQETAHNMLQQPSRLLFHQLSDHVAQDSTDGVEPLVRRADVVETVVVEQYLLHDENGDRLAKLRPRLHDPQAQRDDLCRQEKVDHLGRVILDQGADNTEGGQTEIFEWARLGCRVEERVKEERDVR